MRLRALLFCLLPVLPLGAAPAFAQGAAQPSERTVIRSPILTIDSERVFSESAFGLRVASDVEAQGAALSAENSEIQAELEAEERSLTERRAAMPAEEFRVLADAFDKKVQEIRATQAAKNRALNQLVDQEREIFLNAIAPVLEQLMRDAEAAVILDRRSVFVSANAIDITTEAITRINASLGSGRN